MVEQDRLDRDESVRGEASRIEENYILRARASGMITIRGLTEGCPEASRGDRNNNPYMWRHLVPNHFDYC
jgi:hypothetical protein